MPSAHVSPIDDSTELDRICIEIQRSKVDGAPALLDSGIDVGTHATEISLLDNSIVLEKECIAIQGAKVADTPGLIDPGSGTSTLVGPVGSMESPR